MNKDGHPSVSVVDSHATRPPIPPRLSRGQQCGGAAQTLLFLLMSVALCCIAIEACFIYRLYRSESMATMTSSALIGGEDVTYPTEWPTSYIPPSKPVAQLTDGQDVKHRQQIMAWSMHADPLLYQMDYTDGRLIIQKEGYYYVYSKVYFSEGGIFRHSVDMHTEKYGGGITLLNSMNFSPISSKALSNSYLGGVFHLDKHSALYVTVSNTTKIQRHKSYENIFGAFMI